MTDRPIVSIVVPVKDEEGNIGPLLRRMQETFLDLDYEAILVDGGSTDGTLAEARHAMADVRILTGDRSGRSGAVMTGMRAAKGRYVVALDGDGQHDPGVARDLLETALETGADLVNGSRYLPGGADHGRGVIRRSAGALSRLAIWATIPTVRSRRITDPMSRFFCARRRLVDAEGFDPAGAVLLNVLVQRAVHKVVELPYVAQPRGLGHSRMAFRERANQAAEVARLANREPTNERVGHFGLVAANGFAMQILLLALLSGVMGIQPLLGVVIAIEATILMNFVWHDQITYSDRPTKGWQGRLAGFYAESHTAAAFNVAIFSMAHFAGGMHYLWAEFAALYGSAAVAYGADLVGTYPFRTRLRHRASEAIGRPEQSVMIGVPHNILPTEVWDAPDTRAVPKVQVVDGASATEARAMIGQARGHAALSPREGAAAVPRLRLTWADDAEDLLAP